MSLSVLQPHRVNLAAGNAILFGKKSSRRGKPELAEARHQAGLKFIERPTLVFEESEDFSMRQESPEPLQADVQPGQPKSPGRFSQMKNTALGALKKTGEVAGRAGLAAGRVAIELLPHVLRVVIILASSGKAGGGSGGVGGGGRSIGGGRSF